MRYFLTVCCFLVALAGSSAAFAEMKVPAATSPTFTEPTTGMQFVYIPGGTFIMGDLSGRDHTAQPAHQVSIKPFLMGKFEITFNQYELFCKETDRPLPNDMGWGRGIRPAINVSWHDAVAFTEWLTKKSGKRFRLPTEAEWEYAARGGTTTDFYWGNSLGRSNGNCRGCGSLWDGKSTAAVGSFMPNPFGLYDMAGNVYEWLLDTEHRDYQDAPVNGSAWIDEKNPGWRMTRGGSWNTAVIDVTTYMRCWDKESLTSDNIGFRLVMEK